MRLWNQSASRSNQLLGAKAQAIKNCMEILPKAAKGVLFEFILMVGWENCPWTEEVLGNRKIFPGHVVRHAVKTWTTRLSPSDKSFVTMVQMINHEHEHAPSYMKKKLSKQRAEELATFAACAWALKAEVQALMPIEDSVLEIEFIGKLASGDTKVTCEIELAVSEKSAKFV